MAKPSVMHNRTHSEYVRKQGRAREYGSKITQMQGGEGGRAHYYHATKGWRTRCADVSEAAASLIHRLLDRL